MKPPPAGKKSPGNAGPWLVLAAAVLWGTTGTAQALAPTGAQPAVIGALRLVIGGAALLTLAVSRRAWREPQRWPVLETGLASAGIAAYQLCFFAAVYRTGVAVGTVVGIGSAPILAGVLAFLVNREPPGWRWALATSLAIAGVSLLLTSGGSLQIDFVGVLLALGAGGAYALYTLASKRLLDGRNPDAVMAVIFCLGAALLSPWLFTADLGWLGSPQGLVVALHLGLVATGLSYVLFARGLTRVSAANAVTLTLAEPLTAGLLGIFVLHEPASFPAAIGIGLIFAGLAILSFIPPKPEPEVVQFG